MNALKIKKGPVLLPLAVLVAALAAYTVIIAAAAIGLRCYLGSEKASARFYDL